MFLEKITGGELIMSCKRVERLVMSCGKMTVDRLVLSFGRMTVDRLVVSFGWITVDIWVVYFGWMTVDRLVLSRERMTGHYYCKLLIYL